MSDFVRISLLVLFLAFGGFATSESKFQFKSDILQEQNYTNVRFLDR